MRGFWQRCRAALGALARRVPWPGSPRVSVPVAQAVPPPQAPAGFTADAGLLAAARIATAADCPALRPLAMLAARHGARVEATILATQGAGDAARVARIHAIITTGSGHG